MKTNEKQKKTREELIAKQLLTSEEAADYIEYSVAQLQRWRSTKDPSGPKFINTGKIRYRVKDLDKWLEQHSVDPEVDFAS